MYDYISTPGFFSVGNRKTHLVIFMINRKALVVVEEMDMVIVVVEKIDTIITIGIRFTIWIGKDFFFVSQCQFPDFSRSLRI